MPPYASSRFNLEAEAKAIIGQLRERLSAEMVIISGDQETPTKKLAQELAIEHYAASLPSLPRRCPKTLRFASPWGKAELIGKLQAEGKSVCYIGDGINDSIALTAHSKPWGKKADVSVSLRGASSVAIDSAEVILMDGTLNQLAELFALAQDFETNMSMTNMGIMTPCLINICGVLFTQFTLVHSMMLSGVSVLAGFGSAMWPLVRHQKEQLTENASKSTRAAAARHAQPPLDTRSRRRIEA